MKIWHTAKKKIALNKKKNIWRCTKCPCDCEPKVIARWTTNASTPQPAGTVKCVDFTPYQGDGVGVPEQRWRAIEVGACLLRGGSGSINEDGKLVGLPSSYCSSYNYNGYIELQQGCVQKDGSIKWPGTCR